MNHHQYCYLTYFFTIHIYLISTSLILLAVTRGGPRGHGGHVVNEDDCRLSINCCCSSSSSDLTIVLYHYLPPYNHLRSSTLPPNFTTLPLASSAVHAAAAKTRKYNENMGKLFILIVVEIDIS